MKPCDLCRAKSVRKVNGSFLCSRCLLQYESDRLGFFEDTESEDEEEIDFDCYDEE